MKKTQKSIGRFPIISALNKDEQDTIYLLAQDPHLERLVTIKTLHPAAKDNAETLLREARIVSKLQHPNIATLFDTGEHEGIPYLVFSYIEGNNLAQLMRQEGRLPLVRAARIACNLLDGIAYAHRQGVIHRKLTPSNILINTNDQALLIDFSIAHDAAEEAKKDAAENDAKAVPEILGTDDDSIHADLFAVGMILHEMVTGSPATLIDHSKSTHSLADQDMQLSMTQGYKPLESIIIKAISKQPYNQYANATAMRQALLEYLDPAHAGLPAEKTESHSTLAFLIRIMRNKPDFPSLSSTIGEINKIVDSQTDTSESLTKVILRDFALTTRLLRLVNSAQYGQHSGRISTVSKAVMILGFEAVRNVTMSLVLLEFLKNKSQTADILDDVITAYFSGLVASLLVSGNKMRDAEEAMGCAIFQNLGHLLAAFYFFEQSQEVARMVEQGMSEGAAAREVLGTTYEQLGIGVAKLWNLPDRLLTGMQKLADAPIEKPHNELEQLTATANLANELSAIVFGTPSSERSTALQQLATRYARAYKTTEHQLYDIAKIALQEILDCVYIFHVPDAQSRLLTKVTNWDTHSVKASGKDRTAPDALAGATQLDTILDAETEIDGSTGQPKANAEAILSAGIQDVTNTLVEEYKLNDILQMVLESMYRGMNFNHTLFLVRDSKANQMVARLGFGKEIDKILPKFRFSLAQANNVFTIALSKGADIVIEDIFEKNVAPRIPDWYRDVVGAQSFLLLPVIIKGNVIGLFYADMEEANTLKVSPHQLSMLRTLRNQAVLAIKQKQ